MATDNERPEERGEAEEDGLHQDANRIRADPLRNAHGRYQVRRHRRPVVTSNFIVWHIMTLAVLLAICEKKRTVKHLCTMTTIRAQIKAMRLPEIFDFRQFPIAES